MSVYDFKKVMTDAAFSAVVNPLMLSSSVFGLIDVSFCSFYLFWVIID